MKDVLVKGNELIDKIKASIREIEAAEDEKKMLEEGKVTMYMGAAGTRYFTTLTEEQMAKIKNVISLEIDASVYEARNFVSRMVCNSIPEPTVTAIVAENKPAAKAEKAEKIEKAEKDFDADLVTAELKAGKSVTDIWHEHYPERGHSWIYKNMEKAGINHKVLSAQAKVREDNKAADLDFDSDEWVDAGIDPQQEPEPKAPRRSVSKK